MRYVQKIILLILTTGLVVLFFAVIYVNLIVKKRAADFDFIFPLFFIITGIFSGIFHLKTIKFYKRSHSLKEGDLALNLYWIINAVFGLSLIVLALLFVYVFYFMMDDIIRQESYIFLVMIVISTIIGVWVLIDELMIYQELRRAKSIKLIDSIDYIKGNED